MRRNRYLKQNAVYHVTARINRGEMVFDEPAMRELFISFIKQVKKKYPMAIYNFCIMGNHIHFAIRPDKGASLSKIMQWLLGNYAKAWNNILVYLLLNLYYRNTIIYFGGSKMLGIYCRTSVNKENTSIEQQKKLGIEFCISHNFEYQIYVDEGISGYETSDDDINPFNNRPSFTSLINDIKSKKIDKVWVFEHSRLSRNQYSSAVIFNIFEKYNIKLYENQKSIDLKDPQLQFMRQIMDAVTQLERHLIVNRTTRGLHNSINRGNRGKSNLFGYRKDGKDVSGKIIWTPVESEINDLKYCFEEFLKGKSLTKICYELFNVSNRFEVVIHSKKISRYLKHSEYTGSVLNMEGLSILHKYDNFEIEDISVLIDNKYWVRSISYPIKIVSREDWLEVNKRLHINRIIKKEYKEIKSRATGKNLVTGIISCNHCKLKYYSYIRIDVKKNNYLYYYYKHLSNIKNNDCPQKPKTLDINNVDEIFKTFFFFYYIVFNKSNLFVKESLENIRHNIQTLQTKIKSDEQNINKIRKQKNKLSELLSDVTDKDTLIVTSKKIVSLEKELSDKINEVSNVKIELETLKNKYSKTELENTFTNIKEKVLTFFNDLDTENRRNELIRIIKNCILFGQYLIIDTGNLIFLFDTKIQYKFDEELLNKLDKDIIYKEHFIEYPQTNKKTVRQFNEKTIINLKLTEKTKTGKDIKKYVNNYLKKELNINYDISQHYNLISFISLRGIYSD